MKKLLNTLYVTTENAYLSLDGENVIVTAQEQTVGRIPLHTVDGIVTFGRAGVSPALLGKCAESGKDLVFLTPSGRFLARSSGMLSGNVLLRREQYRIADRPDAALEIARVMISAKLKNSASVLRRAISDHADRLDVDRAGETMNNLQESAQNAYLAPTFESLRGIEGEGARRYFDRFGDLILSPSEFFTFSDRNRRPPTDPVNAMLSFGYSLMASMCASALESVGLDPYVGFFHTLRPGRCSLALDLMEEFRAPFVDRFVLTLINTRQIDERSFLLKEDGAVLLTDDGRKAFLTLWQKKKREEIRHPFLGEKMEWGMLPYAQAMLLAKHIRGDLDAYPPFVWK